MRLAVGARLGTHVIVSPLGAGGMGEVYLATDTRLGRAVALKVLPQSTARDAQAVALFRREALTVASLNHPNIATIYDLEEIPHGPTVLVLEYVEGETLASTLKRGPLAVDEALRIGSQIAEALEAAHERGVIHRDVKPGNVMIGPRGRVKVLDFGLARRLDGIAGVEPAPRGEVDDAEADTLVLRPPTSSLGAEPTSLAGVTVGTPGYMSPEQVLADVVDERSDVFALGCVLYECLAGRRAFLGSDAVETLRATIDTKPDLTRLPAQAPAPLRQLIAQCLEKRPASRPGSMRAICSVLEEALGTGRASSHRGERPIRNNLPAPVTPFVGREATLSECSAALDQTRLLSLVGMGGSGKTRLALELARRRLDAFAGGVWFLDVAPLTEGDRVMESLAAALDVRDEPGRTLLKGITAALEEAALVVLDNAETFPEACGALAAHLIRTCPQVRVLVTSREPFGAAGETVFTVPALKIPGTQVRTSDEAMAFEAVQLFVERARAASQSFELTDANVPSVVEVCRRLDGIPLALELAAARVRVLDVDQIRARIEDRFKLLTRGGATRQQTVLATIQWSWDHLYPAEQHLMRRLAVFSGGWVLDRAVAVCSDSGDEFEVLDLLTRLVERALVVVERESNQATRYRFLETVWRFALDQLATHDEYTELRNRHLAVYLDFVTAAGAELRGAALVGAMARIAPEEENILAALAWSETAPGGARDGLRIAEATSRYWTLQSRLDIGRRVMEGALARDRERAPTRERAAVLARAAGIAVSSGDFARGREALEESHAISMTLEDRQGVARSLAGLAVIAMAQGRLEDARTLSLASHEGYAALGQTRGEAMALHNLGVIAVTQGDAREGLVQLTEARRLLRDVGDTPHETLCLSGLAWAHTRLGEHGEARARLIECLELMKGHGSPREGLDALDAVAHHLIAIQQLEDAALLFGTTQAVRARLGLPYLPFELAEVEQAHARIAQGLGPERSQQALAAGRGLGLETALDRARAMLTESDA